MPHEKSSIQRTKPDVMSLGVPDSGPEAGSDISLSNTPGVLPSKKGKRSQGILNVMGKLEKSLNFIKTFWERYEEIC